MYNYFPLPDTQEDDLFSESDCQEKGESERGSCLMRRDVREGWLRNVHGGTIINCVVVVALLVIVVVQQTMLWQYQHPKDHYIISPYRTVLRQFGLNTPYKSENETVAAEAWDKISTGHGDVVVDPEWAAARGLPPSMKHPLQPEKRIYQLESYHAMHCLKWLRNHYMTMKLSDPTSVHPSYDSDPVTWDLEHDMHCFDELRQHIMCNADDQLMYSSGQFDIGHKQYRLCRDWDALADWAAERSACWKDHINPKPGALWWNQCDDGDGMVLTGGVGL